MNPASLEMIFREPGFDAIKAIRARKVFLVKEALVSRPTFRILEGVEQLHTLFFPGQSK